MNTPKFKVGNVICSSISGPKEVVEIRDGVPEDFAGRAMDWTGDLCYVLRFVGKQATVVYPVTAVDSDFHLEGSEMFNEYQQIRNSE